MIEDAYLKKEIVKYHYSTVILLLLITACNPATAKTATPPPSTETVPSTPTISISTLTPTPAATEEIYRTFTPAPTSTALAPLKPGQGLTLTMIRMMDEQFGWGIDSSEHVVHTVDAGHTWRDVTPQNGAYQQNGFFAFDSNTAWATPYQEGCYTENCAPAPNNASVWHTVDGGNTWQEQHVCLQSQECSFDFDVGPEYYFPTRIDFIDPNNGWLLISVAHMMNQDRYRLYETTDGGVHWLPLMDSFTGPMTNYATGLAFRDNQTGWMSSSEILGATDPIADWSVYQPTDAGLTWNEIQLPEPNPLPEAFAQNTVWCGAYDVNLVLPDALGVTIECSVYTDPRSAYSFYFHSSDGGQHWNSWLKTGDVEFINSVVGWRLTSNNDVYDLEQTRDGGQTWVKLKTVQWSGELDFVNEQSGWAIATHDNASTLVHTMDGGKTWEEIKATVIGP